eukprot:768590-Hanusia_phi.AAC.24
MSINYLLSQTANLVSASNHALLVVAGRLVVGVDDGVGGDSVGVVRLSPGVDGVDVGVGVEEESKHFCQETISERHEIRERKVVKTKRASGGMWWRMGLKSEAQKPGAVAMCYKFGAVLDR